MCWSLPNPAMQTMISLARLPYRWPANARYPIDKPFFDRGYGLTYAKPGEVGVLSEDPGIDLAKAMNVENYFAAGRAAAPWSLSITDAGGKRPVNASSAISPNGKITVKSVDVNAQEDGKAFVFNGKRLGQHRRTARQLAPPVRRVVPASRSIGGSMPMGQAPQRWHLATARFRLPNGFPLPPLAASAIWLFRCGASQKAARELETVGNAFRLEGDKGLAFTLLAVRIDTPATGSKCPPAKK